MVGHGEVRMKFTLLERLTGLVIWPKNRNPCIEGPQPRIITIEQAQAMERFRKNAEKEDDKGDAKRESD